MTGEGAPSSAGAAPAGAASAGAASAGAAGLRPRPEPDPALAAMIAAAVDAVWPRPAPPASDDADAGTHRAWRFSGRWWSRPVAVRRDRPWIG